MNNIWYIWYELTSKIGGIKRAEHLKTIFISMIQERYNQILDGKKQKDDGIFGSAVEYLA